MTAEYGYQVPSSECCSLTTPCLTDEEAMDVVLSIPGLADAVLEADEAYRRGDRLLTHEEVFGRELPRGNHIINKGGMMGRRCYCRGSSWLGILNTILGCVLNRVLVKHIDTKSRQIVGWSWRSAAEFPKQEKGE